jgi:fructokinase
VSMLPHGDRDFVFYRHPSADVLWRAEDVDRSSVAQARVFHFGSVSLAQEPSRTATLAAAAYAAESGALLSYDPNLRLDLWPSPAAAREGMLTGWHEAQVIKVSEDELRFLGNAESIEGAARALWHDGLRLVAVSQGPRGCTYYTPEGSGHVSGFAVTPLDTTGAGDAFVAGTLSGLLAADLTWSAAALDRALTLGNAVGALSTTKIGAMSALPSRAEVLRFMGAS